MITITITYTDLIFRFIAGASIVAWLVIYIIERIKQRKSIRS